MLGRILANASAFTIWCTNGAGRGVASAAAIIGGRTEQYCPRTFYDYGGRGTLTTARTRGLTLYTGLACAARLRAIVAPTSRLTVALVTSIPATISSVSTRPTPLARTIPVCTSARVNAQNTALYCNDPPRVMQAYERQSESCTCLCNPLEKRPSGYHVT